MFSLFRKSPESIAETLFWLGIEISRKIGRQNILQLEQRSMDYVRFVVGAEVLVNLMCQDAVGSAEGYKARSLEISKLLTEKHLEQLTAHFCETVTVANFVVWEYELDHISRCPINPAFAGAYFNNIRLPLPEIVRELYVIRSTILTTDLLKGALVVIQQPQFWLAHLVPVCSTLIMQTTADEKRAADEKTVMGFAASFQVNWIELQLGVREALT